MYYKEEVLNCCVGENVTKRCDVQIQEEMRMELESQHLDDFEDIFAFRDDGHHSPSQPGGLWKRAVIILGSSYLSNNVLF